MKFGTNVARSALNKPVNFRIRAFNIKNFIYTRWSKKSGPLAKISIKICNISCTSSKIYRLIKGGSGHICAKFYVHSLYLSKVMIQKPKKVLSLKNIKNHQYLYSVNLILRETFFYAFLVRKIFNIKCAFSKIYRLI